LVIVLMGVSGSGKTTVGKLLATTLNCAFADADDFHSSANVEKMRTGIPLTDADREPWLQSLHNLIAGWIAAAKPGVLACSALKQSYRERLQISSEVKIVYLRVSPGLLHERLRRRTGHYMSEAMLASQLATLEEPHDALVVNGDRSPEEVTAEIFARLLAR
jgi:gluconokinase